MCSVCEQDKSFIREMWAGTLGAASVHFQKAGDDGRYYADAFPADGVGDRLATEGLPTETELLAAAAVVDDVAGDTSTTHSLTVGAAPIISTINTPGDQDFFRVELQAGVTYEFGQYMTRYGPSGVPLADAYLEIYDADGNLLTQADGGGPFTPSGLDALLTFTATEDGTYYINARSYDESPIPDDNGDFVGDYEIFARVSLYKPYYDLDSPLHSLDWGTQFDGTSRNPDNAEGPRPTGNEVENKIGGKNVLYVYFAREGEVFVDNSADPLNLTTTIVAKGLQPWEKNAFNAVFDEYEKVADLVYVETEDRWAADIVVITYDGTPGPGASLLGRMSPPDTPSEGQTEYNSGDERWTQEGLAPGGFYFGTLIHEFGHGHGMSHPHDNGGRSSIMRGVEEISAFNYTLGDFDLNQGVFTMMSYQDGWQKSPYGQASSTAGYGYIGSLMAFDIAVMQDKYGVNEEWATGDDTYTLMDVNQKAEFDQDGNQTRQATSYKSIWDAGGTDTMVYNGARDANIDLRPATLKYEYGGGGWVSYAWGVFGGYTIANGVTIENATTGSGNDTLIGNGANNLLDGGAGNDTFMLEWGGDDTAVGGEGNDLFYLGGAMGSADRNDGGDGNDQVALHGDYSDGLVFGSGALISIESLALLSGTDSRFGQDGLTLYDYRLTTHDANVAAGAMLIVDAAQLQHSEDVVFDGSAETDGSFHIYAGKGDDRLTGGAGDDVFLFRTDGRFTGFDRVDGGAGGDQLALRGHYAGATSVTMQAETMTGIEVLAILSGNNTHFGPHAGDFHYDITMHDGNVAAGTILYVDAAQLRSGETLTLDASAETDGSYWVWGGVGADTITGGQQADMIAGGGGADRVAGGAGADTFGYRWIEDSLVGSSDTILDFASGDRIDLTKIDADSATEGNQAFTFIDGNAFTGVAGQLRAENAGGAWIVQGDVDGNGVADFEITVIASDGDPITATDFLF